MALKKIGELWYEKIEGLPGKLSGALKLRRDGRTQRIMIGQNREKVRPEDPDYIIFRIRKGKAKKFMKPDENKEAGNE